MAALTAISHIGIKKTKHMVERPVLKHEHYAFDSPKQADLAPYALRIGRSLLEPGSPSKSEIRASKLPTFNAP